MKKLIYYSPRILAVLLVAFLYLFVLEGFSPEFDFMDSLVHFILASIVLVITIIAWKKPIIGGSIFLILGLFYLSLAILSEVWLSSLLIIAIPTLVGLLFLIEGLSGKKT